MRLVQAVAKGRREGLTALRDLLAASMAEAAADKRAPLAKQLAEVMREIDSLPNTEVVNPIDELKAKRARRRSASTDQAPAASGDKRRQGSDRAGSGGGSAS